MLNKEKYVEILSNQKEVNNKFYKLIKDNTIIEKFEKDTGKDVGVIQNQPFYDYRMDVYENKDGKLFRYAHIEYPENKNGAATIIVLHSNNQELYLLENHYRVFHDKYFYEIPRGFADMNDEKSIDTAIRELYEETNIDINQKDLSYKITELGDFVPDTGLSNNTVSLYRIDIYTDSNNLELKSNDDIESVVEYELVTFDSIKDMIKNNKIIDSFTLGAFMKNQLLSNHI